MLQRVMSQIASVKKDMIILEKSEFSTLLAENEVNAFKGRTTSMISRQPAVLIRTDCYVAFEVDMV